MTKIRDNKQLLDARGNPLYSLRDINLLEPEEKNGIYARMLPARLYNMFSFSPETLLGADGERKVFFTAPEGLGFLRVSVRLHADDRDDVFFLEIADTQHQQMELALCIIKDPESPRFDV